MRISLVNPKPIALSLLLLLNGLALPTLAVENSEKVVKQETIHAQASVCREGTNAA